MAMGQARKLAAERSAGKGRGGGGGIGHERACVQASGASGMACAPHAYIRARSSPESQWVRSALRHPFKMLTPTPGPTVTAEHTCDRQTESGDDATKKEKRKPIERGAGGG